MKAYILCVKPLFSHLLNLITEACSSKRDEHVYRDSPFFATDFDPFVIIELRSFLRSGAAPMSRLGATLRLE